MNSKLLILTTVSVFFVFASLYNANTSRKRLSGTTPSLLETKITTLSPVVVVGDRTRISWRVEAPSDFETTKTTVYYSKVSSPSAITKLDSPDAPSYQFHLSDYDQGFYKLPDTFEGYLTFPEAGNYYLRAYALVRGNHLWSEEVKITVTNE